MGRIAFFLYLAMVVVASLITVAYPPGSREVIISAIAWWILALPWSLISLLVISHVESFLWATLGKQGFGILFLLLHVGFVLFNLYLLNRFGRHTRKDGQDQVSP